MLNYSPEQRTYDTVSSFSQVEASKKSGLRLDQVNALSKLMLTMDTKLKLGFSRELVAATLQSKDMMAKYYYWVNIDPVVV